ncbi:MAG: hypothetical protein AAGH15_11715 [Myxococcota bacterium]
MSRALRRLLLADDAARVDQGLALAKALDDGAAIDALLAETTIRGGRLVPGRPFLAAAGRQPLRDRALRGLLAAHPEPSRRAAIRRLRVFGAARQGDAKLAPEGGTLPRFLGLRSLELLHLARLPRALPAGLRRLRVRDVDDPALIATLAARAGAGLRWLDLERVPLESLDGLEGLPQLRGLALRGLRRLGSLAGLSGHPSLRALVLQRLGLPATPIPRLPRLVALRLEGGPAHVALTPESTPSLRRFAARDPGDPTLEGLFAHPSVAHVRIEGALRLLRLAGAAACRGLRHVELLHCAKVDLRGLADAPALETLVLRGSVAVELGALAGAPRLRRVAVRLPHVDLGPLRDLPALEVVDLRGGPPPRDLDALVGLPLRRLELEPRYRAAVPEALRSLLPPATPGGGAR